MEYKILIAWNKFGPILTRLHNILVYFQLFITVKNLFLDNFSVQIHFINLISNRLNNVLDMKLT